MTPPIAHPTINWLAISPEIALAVAGVVIVMLRSVLRRRPILVPLCTVVAISGVVAAGAVQYRLWHLLRHHRAMTTIAGMVRVDPFGVFLGVVVLAATIMALLLSIAYLLAREGVRVHPAALALCGRMIDSVTRSPLYNPRVPEQHLRIALQRVRASIS